MDEPLTQEPALSDKAAAALELLNGSADEGTREKRAQRWVANTIANRPLYMQDQAPLPGLTAFVVAAGPSLAKNGALLRDVGRLGIVICVDAAYKPLLEMGVTPDLCISIDSDGRMWEMIAGCPTARTTLAAMASASPELLARWEGPRFFFRAMGGTQNLDEKLIAANRQVRALKDIKAGEIVNAVEDVKVEFGGLRVAVMAGGNVTTTAHSFARDVLRAARVVFVGADYSWIEDGEFYTSGAHGAFGKERIAAEKSFEHVTLDGADLVQTNLSMFSFKNWHDKVAELVPDHCVNATEGGILGVGRDGQALPGWEHMTLAEAIAKFTIRAPEAVPA